MSESDEWPRERYPERLRIHGIGRVMEWASTEPQEPWQEIIGYEDGEDDAPDSAAPYIRADVVEHRIAAARAEEREACAKIADGWVHFYVPNHVVAVENRRVAAAIRARGEGGGDE